MPAPPPPSSSTIVRFFKIITKPSVEDGKLRIPNGFTRKYGDNMSNPFSLKTSDGKEWSIHWTKNDEDIWFQKGWKEFATHYSLDHGHMVLFEYDKNTNQFEVHIFDESSLEIEYNFHGSQSEQNNFNQISDDSGESLDEIPQCKKTRPKSPMSCPQPHKKPRTNTSENVVTSFKVQNLSAVDMWNMIPQSLKTRPKSPLSTPQPHKKSKTDKSEDGGRVKAGTTECSKSEKGLESLTSKIAEALHTAFTANYPTFTVIMLSTFVNQHLNVPSKFAKMYFERKQSNILLQVLDERTWPVEYHLGRIDVGWKTFASENSLKVGDVCIFELTKREPLILKVLIFRCGEKTHFPPPQESVQGDEVNLLDPEKLLEVKNEPIISEEVNRETRRNSLEDRDSPLSNTNEALNEAKKFTSENPFFRITVTAKLPNYTVNVPKHFSSKYFGKTQTVMLKVQEKTWPVKLLCYPYQAPSSFSAGWSLFVQECKLQTGDVCVFELINKENVVLDVHIFRSKPIMTNKESVQGDEVNFLDPEKLLEVENEPIISEEVNRETRRNSLGDRDSPLSNTNEALNEAKKFTSENPFFRITVAELPIYTVNVPKHFSSKYFEKTQTVMLKVQEKTWPVKLLCHPYQASSRVSAGWSLFVQECKLQTGDVCVFELINKENVVLDVHIFRSKSIMTNKESVQGDEVNFLDPEKSLEVENEPISSEEVKRETRRNSLGDRDSPLSNTNEALNEAKKFTSENPFFRITVAARLQIYTVNVPKHFSSKYFEKTQTVMLKVQEKTWPVKLLCYPYQASSSFSAGWSLFVQECKLQTGDVCVFELVNKENVVLDVHIFRSKSIRTNKDGKETRRASLRARRDSLTNGALKETKKITSDATDGKETPTTPLQTSCDSFTNEALKEAKKFTSENPLFIVNIKPIPTWRKFVPRVPSAFTRDYMHSKTQTVKLQFDKKSWPVNCLCYSYKKQMGSLGSGWNVFAEENKVQAGDVCVFELIKKEDAVFDVHIFRGHS